MSEFNFHLDLKNEIIKIFHDSGLKASSEENIHKLLIDFFNLKSKILEPKKRNVFIVPSFNEQIEGHHKNIEIKKIIKYAKQGRNLNPFQSERIIESKQIDHLSNEWNIYHFHLSLKPQKKPKFVKRGNLLLFAYIDEENIVFLGVSKHKDSFGNIKWLEILENNFPHLLEKFLPPDLPDIGINFDTSEREEMWRAGVSSGFIKLNGKTYLSPGFGKVTGGHNIQVVMQSNYITNWTTRIKKIVIENKNDVFNERNCLKLRFGESTIEIYDCSNEAVYFKYPSFKYILQ